MDEQNLDLMLRTAIPVDDMDRMVSGPAEGFAIAWVDLSDRPDLQHLSDRHAEGAEGELLATLFYSNPGKHNMRIGLRIQMIRPTESVIILAFEVRKFFDQLHFFADSGTIWIVQGPPPTHLVGTIEMTAKDFIRQVVSYCGHGLFITLEPMLCDELRRQLDAWKQRK